MPEEMSLSQNRLWWRRRNIQRQSSADWNRR